ncbi:STAS domain-containing protein [Fictibacillus aquaticus]|uniref:STAS domain-containing protein n=1 Tax=Fictibacillus aquaticus TaxID=2021314 RepID=A0A235FDQ0_9BACL|nr:STAS domain-containing protein [Fictibacillus aquaticus]OYD59332.1 hypothetical protein CGZ90_05425 [Fictibacillus aquaticus]
METINQSLLNKIGNELSNQSFHIAKQVLTDRFNRFPVKNNIPHNKEMSHEFIKTFIILFGESLMNSDLQEAERTLMNWADQTANFAVKYGQSLDVALQPIPFVRLEIIAVLKNIAEIEDIPMTEWFDVIKKIAILFDFAHYRFCETYVENYQKKDAELKNTLQQYAYSVVPLFEGLGVLPLKGQIESEEMFLKDTVLHQCLEQKLTALIIDLSGVYTLNENSIIEVFQLTDALKLLGVRIILTGFRPELAIKAIQLNVQLDRVQTLGSLKQALSALQYTKN